MPSVTAPTTINATRMGPKVWMCQMMKTKRQMRCQMNKCTSRLPIPPPPIARWPFAIAAGCKAGPKCVTHPRCHVPQSALAWGAALLQGPVRPRTSQGLLGLLEAPDLVRCAPHLRPGAVGYVLAVGNEVQAGPGNGVPHGD